MLQTNREVVLAVLSELLRNADRFTEKGSIILGCYQTDAANVCFSITDTGMGIPENERERVFVQFVKLNEFSEGLGLGLTLCQNAVKQMGGSIRLDDTYNTGTRIIITLPLD